jgi:hypothetical protein
MRINLVLMCAVVLAACGVETVESDAGTTGNDAGANADAGVVDAGPVDAGLSDAGSVQDGGSVDPYDVASVCTSKTFWQFGNNSDMRPGEACASCHKSHGGAPQFTFAGTVYPTAREPDRCNSQTFSGLQIVIIDANGTSHTLSQIGSKGNFGTETAYAKPYTAKLVYQGRERVMTTPQTNGDCNSCHTQNGASGAPGRLLLP